MAAGSKQKIIEEGPVRPLSAWKPHHPEWDWSARKGGLFHYRMFQPKFARKNYYVTSVLLMAIGTFAGGMGMLQYFNFYSPDILFRRKTYSTPFSWGNIPPDYQFHLYSPYRDYKELKQEYPTLILPEELCGPARTPDENKETEV